MTDAVLRRRDRFAGARVAHLATADADGTPHVVPVTFAVVGDRIVVVIDGKPKSGRPLRRIRNIETNPRVSVLVDHYDEDWLQLWWARADGLARIVHAGPELAESVAVLRAKYPQYATMVATDGPAIAIDVDRWSGWEFRAQ